MWPKQDPRWGRPIGKVGTGRLEIGQQHHFSGSSLDLDRGWQTVAPWSSLCSDLEGPVEKRKTRRCGKAVFETSKRGSDQRKADGRRRLGRKKSGAAAALGAGAGGHMGCEEILGPDGIAG